MGTSEMSTTLEHDIDQLAERLSEMSDRARHSNEWEQINAMHLTACELKAELRELRQRELRNLKQKGEHDEPR